MGDRLAADLAGGDLARPASQERNAVAPLPGVALGAAERAHAVVPVLLGAVVDPVLDLAGDLGTVVAGEDHQGVVGQAAALQRIEYLADGPVDLDHEVAVFARPALARGTRPRGSTG